MKIEYDKDIKIAGIGMVPWTRVGLEKWLPNYRIASLYGWDLPENSKPEVKNLVSFNGGVPKLAKINTQNLIANTEFQKMLDTYFEGYDMLTYKPVEVPEELDSRKFLMVPPEFTKTFENKVTFRKMMSGEVTFPNYVFCDRSELVTNNETYDKIAEGRSRFIIQDEQLSGGKGTFIVDSFERYLYAVASLNKLSKSSKVVVSDFIEHAEEYSIQACVTKFGIFCGPLQRQIVINKHLANINIADGDKFCGAQIDSSEQNSEIHKQATREAMKIGKKLQEKGYRGIFGVDFLRDSWAEKLYTLEVNPRITGITPLLTALYEPDKSIPFYLLHVLELGNYDYSIQDTNVEYHENGSLLVMHSRHNQAVMINKTPKSGTYTLNGDSINIVDESIDVKKSKAGQFVIEEFMPQGMVIKPGGRLLVIKLPSRVIDAQTNQLTEETVNLINIVYKNIDLSVVTSVV